MSLDLESNWGFLLCILLLAGLCSLVGGGIIVAHFVLVSKANVRAMGRREDAAADFFSLLWTRYGTWLTAVMFWLICFTVFLMRGLELAGLNQFPCAAFVKLVSLEQKIAKLCGYSVLVSHCHVVFQNSAFAYSRRFIYTLYALIALAATIFCTYDIVQMTGSKEHTGYASNGRHVEEGSKPSLAVCVMDIKPVKLLSAVGVVFNTLLSLFILALFVRPLKSLLKQQRELSPERRPSELKDIAIELLPLKYTSIVTTTIFAQILVTVLLNATHTPIFKLPECVVNIFCFVAMTKYWAAVYWTVFGPMLLCISRVPGFGERNGENVRAIIAHYRSDGMPAIVKTKSHSGIAGSGQSKRGSAKNRNPKSASTKDTITSAV